MANFQQISFGDLYAIPSKNGLMAPSRIRGTGVPLINMREMFSFSRISTQEMELAPLPFKDSESWLVEPGDLLFARQSLVAAGAGKCVLVQEANLPRTFESHIIRVRLRRDLCNPAFYFYYFNSATGRISMASIVEQVAAAGIRASDLSRLKVPVPPLELQNSIAETLGALDDKIESNQRIQSLSLSLARAMFDQSLYSAEFSRLSDIATVVLGGTPSKSEAAFWGGQEIAWINSGAANQEIIVTPTAYITPLGLQNSAAKLMPAGATVLAITGATLGQVAILGIETAGNQSLVGIWGSSPESNAWIHFAIQARIDELLTHATGAAQQHVNKQNVEQLVVPVIDLGEREKWGRGAVPLVERAVSAATESLQLAALRDALLPELLSGRIRVNEAAK